MCVDIAFDKATNSISIRGGRCLQFQSQTHVSNGMSYLSEMEQESEKLIFFGKFSNLLGNYVDWQLHSLLESAICIAKDTETETDACTTAHRPFYWSSMKSSIIYYYSISPLHYKRYLCYQRIDVVVVVIQNHFNLSFVHSFAPNMKNSSLNSSACNSKKQNEKTNMNAFTHANHSTDPFKTNAIARTSQHQQQQQHQQHTRLSFGSCASCRDEAQSKNKVQRKKKKYKKKCKQKHFDFNHMNDVVAAATLIQSIIYQHRTNTLTFPSIRQWWWRCDDDNHDDCEWRRSMYICLVLVLVSANLLAFVNFVNCKRIRQRWQRCDARYTQAICAWNVCVMRDIHMNFARKVEYVLKIANEIGWNWGDMCVTVAVLYLTSCRVCLKIDKTIIIIPATATRKINNKKEKRKNKTTHIHDRSQIYARLVAVYGIFIETFFGIRACGRVIVVSSFHDKNWDESNCETESIYRVIDCFDAAECNVNSFYIFNVACSLRQYCVVSLVKGAVSFTHSSFWNRK